jgi:hypothetical protein
MAFAKGSYAAHCRFHRTIPRAFLPAFVQQQVSQVPVETMALHQYQQNE